MARRPKKSNRVRKPTPEPAHLRSGGVRLRPVYKDRPDIDKFAQALLDLARHLHHKGVDLGDDQGRGNEDRS